MFTIKPVQRENGAPTWKEELARRRAEFGGVLGRGLAYRITVPLDMAWWFWDEFGTSQFAEKITNTPSGYDIAPVEAKVLVFPGKDGETQVRTEVFMEGIHPKHMVTSVFAEIKDISHQSVLLALIQSGFEREKFKEFLRTYMMPNIKEVIRQSFQDNLDQYYGPGGRPTHTARAHTLGGHRAWEEFEANAQIVEID